MKTYIHWGGRKLEKNRIKLIRNREHPWNKPYGGFWVSDECAPFGWKEWNDGEQFREYEPDEFFKIRLAEDANIIILDSVKSWYDFQKNYGISSLEFDFAITKAFDFEWMVHNKVDAITIELSKCHNLYDLMWGWDCDSTLILNTDVIEEV